MAQLVMGDDDDDECLKYPLSSTPASLLLLQTEFQERHSEGRTIFTVEERVTPRNRFRLF